MALVKPLVAHVDGRQQVLQAGDYVTAAALGSGTADSTTYLRGDNTWASFSAAVDWANPGTIGSTTPNTGAFTTLSTTGTTKVGTGAAQSWYSSYGPGVHFDTGAIMPLVSGDAMYYVVNARPTTGSTWVFVRNAYATIYDQLDGQHRFRTSSASGTAGNTITWVTAMTIASGSGGVTIPSVAISSGSINNTTIGATTATTGRFTTVTSTIATGTAPLTVTSTTKVTNLNADLLDGYDTATAATASTVAVRDASADLYARRYYATSSNGAYIDGDTAGLRIAGGYLYASGALYVGSGLIARGGISNDSGSGNVEINDSLVSTGSLTIGSGGNYAAGSIYSDSNWGMIFRAKQASPANAEFLWVNSAGSGLASLSSGGSINATNFVATGAITTSGGNISTTASTGQFVSTQTGYAPIAVSSTIVCTNLNADLFDNFHRRIDLSNFTSWDGTALGPVGWYNFSSSGPAGGSYHHGYRTAMADTNYGHEVAVPHDTDAFYYRRYAGGFQSWVNLANRSSGTWTPTFTANGANPTVTLNYARWERIGNMIFFLIDYSVTNTNGGNTYIAATLPATPTYPTRAYGNNESSGYMIQGRAGAGSNVLNMLTYDNLYPYLVGLGGTQRIVVRGMYEA